MTVKIIFTLTIITSNTIIVKKRKKSFNFTQEFI